MLGVERVVTWARVKSPWILHFNTGACNACDIEIIASLMPQFDMERFGVILKATPRHADVLVCSGPVTLQIKERLVRMQVAAGALVLIPVVGYYGHYDDVLALTFVILSARDLSKQRWMRAAVMLGIAVGFKQWAWMALPLLLAVTPKEQRLRSLLPSAVAPAAFFALVLAVDWSFASLALLKADTCPACGHAALWVPQQAMNFVGGPPRMGVFFVAFGVAWKMRKRFDATSLSAALGVTLLARLAFEPVVYFYHVAPALALLMLYEQLEHGRPWRTLVLGGCLIPWFGYYPSVHALWWVAFAALVVAIAWPAGKLVFAVGSDPVVRGRSMPTKRQGARR